MLLIDWLLSATQSGLVIFDVLLGLQKLLLAHWSFNLFLLRYHLFYLGLAMRQSFRVLLEPKVLRLFLGT